MHRLTRDGECPEPMGQVPQSIGFVVQSCCGHATPLLRDQAPRNSVFGPLAKHTRETKAKWEQAARMHMAVEKGGITVPLHQDHNVQQSGKQPPSTAKQRRTLDLGALASFRFIPDPPEETTQTISRRRPRTLD
jgi:hypothetical protein